MAPIHSSFGWVVGAVNPVFAVEPNPVLAAVLSNGEFVAIPLYSHMSTVNAIISLLTGKLSKFIVMLGLACETTTPSHISTSILYAVLFPLTCLFHTTPVSFMLPTDAASKGNGEVTTP